MKKRLVPIAALIIIAFLLIYLYFLEEEKREKGVLILYGNVDVRQVDLGFQVTGRVVQMDFQEGDYIAPGTLMGVLDKQPYLDLVKQSEASLQAIKVNLNNAEKLLKRRLEFIVNGGVSQEDVDNAIASQEALTANLKQAEATLGVSKTNLGYTELYAPSEGVILTRIREPGTVVNVGDPIYTLTVSNPVWIRAFVPEIHLGQIFPGMEAEVFTDNPEGKAYKGKIGFISPVAEFTPKTVETTELRTDLVYRLRIYIDHPDQGLRQGMPVTVKLKLNQKNNVPFPEK